VCYKIIFIPHKTNFTMISKRLSCTLLAIFIFQILSFSQAQLGGDIIGETFEDQFGQAMALSDDGTILAIGAKENDEVASNSGHVRLYKWEDDAWTQLGGDIDGVGSSDRLGTSIALSASGLVVACGAPENGAPKGYVVIREWDGNAWLPKGEILEGIGVGERFGISVSLSADGNRVAVGAIHNDDAGSNAGQVKVYDWNGDSWQQIGPPINGTMAGDNTGSAVSLSADGNRLAIGATDNDETGNKAGQVRVFEFAADSTWQQIGMDIYGEDTRDESGTHVRLSSDGNRLAISAPFNDGNGNWSGHVRVYEWQDSSWTQMGADLDGEKEFVVYSDDPVEARYILSPLFMEKLLACKERLDMDISISFYKSNIYIAIPVSKDFFEPGLFRTIINPEKTEEYFEDMKMVLEIIDELSLNTRIWSKMPKFEEEEKKSKNNHKRGFIR